MYAKFYIDEPFTARFAIHLRIIFFVFYIKVFKLNLKFIFIV